MTLLNNTLPEIRRGKLKSLLKQKRPVRVLEAHNGISGIIANNTTVEGEEQGDAVKLEFDALWESSLTDSASKGHPDIEVVSFDSRLQTIYEILAVTNKPMIVDGDTGGDANNFEYMVSKLERAGVSAVIIEDKVFPKRNSLETGAQQTLEDPHVFAQKIKRGKRSQLTDDFMIISRIESLIAGKPMDEALDRARIYLEAGVDGIMIHSKSKKPDEIIEFSRRYKQEFPAELINGKPLVCVPTTYNSITEEELGEQGFNIVIHANHLLRAAYKAMEETAKTILTSQRSFEADPQCSAVREIFSAVGFLDVKKKDEENELTSNIAVIIPAAGEDSLLKKQLNGKPKAMLELGGKTLLQRQVAALNHNNLTDVTVVTGYASNQIAAEGVSFIENKDYKNGTPLHSVFAAKEKMSNGFLMLYSDILLEEHIITKLLGASEDIVLVVDNAVQYHRADNEKLLDYIISKNKHKLSHRKISFVHENLITKIGNKLHPDTVTHEFIGLAKFSKTGSEQFIQTYQDCLQNYEGKFQEAEDITQFTFTDLIQEMIDRGFAVNFLEIHKGWMEIHHPEDIELANELL
ncbi:MAG: phosphoenolpyruvate mutase [Candidatus Nitrohelix vancouverensis]|uniref:phosphoenolpyruvate mutase n=1 Tax=Candidatus Nitrohelix vancouverensis TaxID=2705534 RepID=A0A7T0C4I4_9BACT|nr:MAG: phosphoenolpyruvate mutase [Candidatus Nitrohelix vancouverensis]